MSTKDGNQQKLERMRVSMRRSLRYSTPLNRGSFEESLGNATITSPYDRKKLEAEMEGRIKLYGNRVWVPWYRRYAYVLPPEEAITFQPFKEIERRDEDIALNFIFGTHDCMSKPPEDPDCKKTRQTALHLYTRMKERHAHARHSHAPIVLTEGEEDEETQTTSMPLRPPQSVESDVGFGLSKRDADRVNPVLAFLAKLHVRRNLLLQRKELKTTSKWHRVRNNMDTIKKLVIQYRRQKAYTRLKKVFKAVFCVNRFINFISTIAGETTTMLGIKSFTVQNIPEESESTTESSVLTEEHKKLFNVQKFRATEKLFLCDNVRLILSKQWRLRTPEDITLIVGALSQVHSFIQYPPQFQRYVAQVAWLTTLKKNQVIIRETQGAIEYYIVVSGKVNIVSLHGNPSIDSTSYFSLDRVCKSLDMFGDECICGFQMPRTYTATCQTQVDLLSINMHDLGDLLSLLRPDEVAPPHIIYLGSLPNFSRIPKKALLEATTDDMFYFYFRESAVLAKSLIESENVFVIKSGRCDLLVELKPANKYRLSYEKKKEELDREQKLLEKIRLAEFKSHKNEFWELIKEVSEMQKIGDTERDSILTDRKTQYEDSERRDDIESILVEKENALKKKDFVRAKECSINRDTLKIKEECKMTFEKNKKIARSLPSKLRQELDVRKTSFFDERLEFEWKDSRTSKTRAGSRSSRVGPPSTKSQDGNLRRSIKVGTDSNRRKSQAFENPNLEERQGSSMASRRSTMLFGTEFAVRQLDDEAGSYSNPVSDGKILSRRSSAQRSISDGTHGQAKRRKPNELDDLDQIKGRHSIASHGKYSKWKLQAALTNLDVAGFDYVDLADGCYNPPNYDGALVSRGAAVIVIKKSFIIQHLSKER